jgi:hypothetical protein
MKLKYICGVYSQLLVILFSFFSNIIFGHGFAEDTAILLCDAKSSVYLYDLCMHGKPVRAGTAIAPATIRFTYYDEQLKSYNVLTCTPLQEFYLFETNTWIPAYRLQKDDLLFSRHGFCVVDSVENCIGKQAVYLIEMAATHTFFVGRSGLLTHNMGLSCALNIGLSIPFGVAAGGGIGSFFGPVTIIAGIVVGSAIGIAAQLVCANNLKEYNFGAESHEWHDYLYLQDAQNSQKNSVQQDSNSGGAPNKKPEKNDSNEKIEIINGARKVVDQIEEEARKIGWENTVVPTKEGKVVFNHIWNNNDGHELFSEAANQELCDLVKDPANFLGKDENGKAWFGKIRTDGKQRWAYAYGGKVKSAGLNPQPNQFCSKNGLIKSSKIKIKTIK